MRKNRKNRSIYSIVLIPLLLIFLAEMAAIVAIPTATGVLQKLDENEEKQLQAHVAFRENQLDTAMGASWSDLNRLSATINSKAEKLLAREDLSMEQLQENEALKEELLREITNERNCNFVLFVGSKRLIKRRLFDAYIEKIYSI